jgi:hypothetical protein
MKKTILGSVFLSLVLYAQPGELVIDLNNGQNTVPLEQIRKIHFSTEQPRSLMITEKNGGTVTYQIPDIERIQFTQPPVTAISPTGNPGSFTLYQNFPNPFNPSTTIHYVISQSGWVELQIFNIEGQLVRHLNSVYRDPGHYEFEWTGTNTYNQSVPSGIYFCRIRQNQQTMTIKMVLNR